MDFPWLSVKFCCVLSVACYLINGPIHKYLLSTSTLKSNPSPCIINARDWFLNNLMMLSHFFRFIAMMSDVKNHTIVALSGSWRSLWKHFTEMIRVFVIFSSIQVMNSAPCNPYYCCGCQRHVLQTIHRYCFVCKWKYCAICRVHVSW